MALSITANYQRTEVRVMKWRRTLLLLGTMCIPIVLSAAFFMGQSLRLDESQSLWQASRGVLSIFTIVASDVHVPLYHLLLHFWLLLFGDTIVSARAMSLFLYVVSIPALYALGKLTYNRNVGLFAAFLFSISPFMNWYGNEIRMYTLFALFTILNQYCFIRIFKDRRGISEHVWVGYVLTAVLGVFSHYFFFLNFLAQAIFYVWRRRLFAPYALGRFLVALGIVLTLFIPWGIYVLHLGEAGFSSPLLSRPTSVDLFSTFSQFVVGFQNDSLNTFFLSLWPITIIFGVLLLRRRKPMPETEYLLITVIVSILFTFIASLTVVPVFVSRYLIFTVPSLYLLLAAFFSSYSVRFSKISRYALAGIMLLGLGFEIANPTAPVKENYAQAASFLNTHVTPQDAVVLSAPFTVYPVEYYYKGPTQLQTLPLWNRYAYGPIPAFSSTTLPQQVGQITANTQNVYLLLSYDQGYESTIKQYFDAHYQRLYSQTFSHDLTLYVYKVRYDTSVSSMATRFP